MKNWFLSLQGTITLSVFAFLSHIGRVLMDWRYESHLMGAAGSLEEFLYVLMVLVFMGIYTWGMLTAVSGSRRGLITCLILVLLLNIGFALATFFIWCPPADCTSSPICCDGIGYTWFLGCWPPLRLCSSSQERRCPADKPFVGKRWFSQSIQSGGKRTAQDYS